MSNIKERKQINQYFITDKGMFNIKERKQQINQYFTNIHNRCKLLVPDALRIYIIRGDK